MTKKNMVRGRKNKAPKVRKRQSKMRTDRPQPVRSYLKRPDQIIKSLA